ncbi:lytic polysaccharide monooxygenase [Prauserella shujinwangii]|nr:lytic polysaccharide monooxygenase [Prauserella shujinwangii]
MRRVALLGLLAALTGGLVVVSPAREALAHGGMTYPATRTYACYLDGKQGGQGGDLAPTNPACAAAVAAGGKTPLWNWFGNLLSDAGGRHREIIPDGKLCGPSPTFDAYNAPHPDWPTTTVQAGAAITFRYNAWAAHPGTWYQYVTKDGWDPDQPLGWDDLEPVPFDQVTNPPIDGSGPEGAEYTWNARLPSGKSGRHIIYSIWQRSDSPEAFYNCSDVVFGPGNGEDPGDPGDPGDPVDPVDPVVDCEVGYSVQSEWNNGYVAQVAVTNRGAAALPNWTLTFGNPEGQRVTNAWNAAVSQEGGTVTVTGSGHTTGIPAGGTVSFGFQGTLDGAHVAPSGFRLNGTDCD